MNEAPVLSANEAAEHEALRQRWRLAKADGTVEAFARELWEQRAFPREPPPVFESEQVRTGYTRARELFPAKLSDFAQMLPVYFGDDEGTPVNKLLDGLEAPMVRSGPTEKVDGPAL